MNYLIYDPATGEILRSVSCPPEAASIQVHPGEAMLEGEVVWGQQYVLDDVLTDYTPEQAAAKAAQPRYASEWSNTTFSWSDLRDLSQVKADRWTVIKQARDTAINAPLPTPYGSFDADARSQKNITDAIALLQALETSGTPQTIDFTLADNSVAVLTTAQMVEVGLLLGARTQEAYATARQLRADIEAASTQEEVEAVVWPT